LREHAGPCAAGPSADVRGRRPHGLELVADRCRTSGRAGGRPRHETIPRGRHTRFETEEYEILPKGRYDIVERTSTARSEPRAPPRGYLRAPQQLGGVDLRVESAIDLIERELAPFIEEMDVRSRGRSPPPPFFCRTKNYESVDAELLYAFVRARKRGGWSSSDQGSARS